MRGVHVRLTRNVLAYMNSSFNVYFFSPYTKDTSIYVSYKKGICCFTADKRSLN